MNYKDHLTVQLQLLPFPHIPPTFCTSSQHEVRQWTWCESDFYKTGERWRGGGSVDWRERLRRKHKADLVGWPFLSLAARSRSQMDKRERRCYRRTNRASECQTDGRGRAGRDVKIAETGDTLAATRYEHYLHSGPFWKKYARLLFICSMKRYIFRLKFTLHSWCDVRSKCGCLTYCCFLWDFCISLIMRHFDLSKLFNLKMKQCRGTFAKAG